MNRNDKKNKYFPKSQNNVSTTEVKATSAPLLALFTDQYKVFFSFTRPNDIFPLFLFHFPLIFVSLVAHIGSQPCLTQWNYEPCCIGPPKMDESWWRVLTKCGPLEKGMENHFSILALRTPSCLQPCYNCLFLCGFDYFCIVISI